MERLQKTPGAFGYVNLGPPYVFAAKYRRTGRNPPYEVRAEHPSSIIGLLNTPAKRVRRPRQGA